MPGPKLPAGTEKVAFKVEWLDPAASLKRYYLLQYYLGGSQEELELFDLKARRVFLRRCPYPSVTLEDLFIGAKVTVYARQMTVVDFGDEATRRLLAGAAARTFGVVSPGAVSQLGTIVKAVNDAGLVLGHLKMLNLSSGDTRELGVTAPGLTSGPSVALELVGADAYSTWQGICDSLGGACVAADSADAAEASVDKCFGADKIDAAKKSTARLRDCTVCIIKPHALAKQLTGGILDEVFACGLEVTAVELFDIDLVASEEFLEVYKGVVPEYHQDAEQLASGRFIVIELCGDNAVNRFREVVGPMDVEIAAKLRPDTIRAKFGVDRVRNAVHATDLDEDGELESEYFFSILQ